MAKRSVRYNPEQNFRRKVRAISNEIDSIDELFYSIPGEGIEAQYWMLERKRDDVVRGTVLQLHTAIEDLLTDWLKSHLLGVPMRALNSRSRRRNISYRAIDDLLTGGGAIGFEKKLKLLLGLRLIRKRLYGKLMTLNSLRNKCSHNWLLKAVVRKGISPRKPKPPLLRYNNRDLHSVETLRQFASEYGGLYAKLFRRVYVD